jgi:hypothetical protein
MQSFMTYGPATAVLDYTSDFSALLIGLISVVGVSAVMIAWAAIRHSMSQTQQPLISKPPLAANQQEAA